MTTLRFTSELIDDLQFRGGEKFDGTSDYEAQALVYINRAYRELYMGGGQFSGGKIEQWHWMEDVNSGAGLIDSVIRAGSAAVTRGSTAISLSSPPAISVVGYRFRADDDEDIYRVVAHTAGAAAVTLSPAYTGTTGGAKNFRLMRFDYPLPAAAIKVVSPIYFYQDGGRECKLVDLDDITRYWISGGDLSGVPNHFAMSGEAAITFDRYGSDEEGANMVYELRFKTRPADLMNSGTDEPLVPQQWRHVIVDMALYYLFQDKDDVRSQNAMATAQEGIRLMKIDNRALLEQAGEVGHIYPRGRRGINRVRTSSGKLIGYFR